MFQEGFDSDSARQSYDYRLRGIAGWDKVDALAEALVTSSGLSLTEHQVSRLKDLYTQLADYDKRPLTYPLRVKQAPRGRFARSRQNRSGYVTSDAVKR